MSSRDLRLVLFAAVVSVLAAFALVCTIRVMPVMITPVLVALTVVATFSEILAVEFASINFSITYAACAATTILFGPAAGALATGLATIPASLLSTEKKIFRVVFNFTQSVLAVLAGGWAYVAAGGRLIAGAPLSAPEMPHVLLPLALLTLASFVVNSSLVAGAVAINTERPFFKVWKGGYSWTIPSEIGLAVLALALAQIVASEGLVGLGLFVVPLVIARQFYERYAMLKKAYADTVRTLVAFIEAKDAYTRGHSERVAEYSIDIARRLGMSEERVERIELAALLHDLGKVGISRSILWKEGRLTEEELEQIKAHPEIGARIIKEVPFLADLVPLIEGHHERIDGTGYGNALQGEDIPIESRILGVADAFDAMTSSRPYRAALSLDDTVRELRRCAGSQFDQVIVETFVDAIFSGAFVGTLSRPSVTHEAI